MKRESARNGPENSTLTPKQESAALALAAGSTQEDAARISGAGVRTIKTWLYTHDAFAFRIRELRTEMTARALGQLVEGMASAAETLGYLCRKGKSEMVRLTAARSILELGTRLRESIEFEDRIAALEVTQTQKRRAA